MGWLETMDEQRAETAAPAVPTAGPELSTLTNTAPWLLDALGGTPSTSGERVSEERALRLSVVYACVRLIAETASLPPLRLIRREQAHDQDGRPVTRRHKVDDLPEARVIRHPNPFMTEAFFRETLTAHLALWRNAYAEIERDENGDPLNLWPIPPWLVEVEVVDGQKVLVVGARAREGHMERRTLYPGAYLHLPALSLDGLRGRPLLSPGVREGGDARDSVGLSLAIERDAALFYRHGMKMQGYWVTEGQLEDDARDLLEQEIRSLTQGLDNFHRTALLEEGIRWEAFGDGSAAVQQLLAMRVFQVQDIARFFGITQLHKLGDLSRATFSNIGEQREEFYTDSMMVYFVRWEQFTALQLLPAELQRDHYFKFNVRALLRGSFAEELESLRGSVIDGILTLDEARELLDLDPYPDGIGALPRFQLNTASAGTTATPTATEPTATPPSPSSTSTMPAAATPSKPPSPRELARAVVQALRPQLQRSAEHYTRREARAAQRAWSKTGQRPANFADAMEQTWADLPEAIRRELEPVVEGLVAALVALGGEGEALRDAAAGYVDEAIERHVGRSRDELAAGLAAGGLVERFEIWESQRAEGLAAEECDHLADRLLAVGFDEGAEHHG